MTNDTPTVEDTLDTDQTDSQRTDTTDIAKSLDDFAEDDETLTPNPGMNRRAYLKGLAATGIAGLGIGTASLPASAATTIDTNETGTYDDSFYTFWTNEENTVTMTMESGNSYSVEWEDTGNFVLGMGWNPGGRRTIEYDAEHDPTDNSYLCVYGWTTDPLVEYYIIENYGTYRPGDQSLGTHETNGSEYELATSERVEKPSIEGTATFTQYWSIREDLRTSGTIDIGSHFDAWESVDLTLGSHDYQVMAVEAFGYQGGGSASVTYQEVTEDQTTEETTTEETTTEETTTEETTTEETTTEETTTEETTTEETTTEETTTEETTTSEEPTWPADATDPDGDGLYEDLDGDGETNFPDVNILFQNTGTSDIEDNAEFYDFEDGDGVTLQDVMALFQMV